MKRTFAPLLALVIGLMACLAPSAQAQIETTTKYGLQMTLKEVVVDHDDLQAAAADASTDTAAYIDDILPAFGDALPLYFEAAVLDTVDSATVADVQLLYYLPSGDTVAFVDDTLDIGTSNQWMSMIGLLNTTANVNSGAVSRGKTANLYYRSNITLDAITQGRIRIRAYYINE